MKPRVFAIMCTVTAMFLLAFSMLAPWISVTRTSDISGGGQRSESDSYHLEYFIGDSSRMFEFGDDNPLGSVMSWTMVMVIAWLAIAIPFVRLCLGRSRMPTVIASIVLLLVSLAVAIYFPIAAAYAAADTYPQSEDYVLSYSLQVGWFILALATIIQSIGILQLLYFSDSSRWQRALLEEPEQI